MQIKQLTVTDLAQLPAALQTITFAPDWVLILGSPELIADPYCLAALQAGCAEATLVGCSTAGEINQAGVHEHSLVITAVQWAAGRPQLATTQLADMEDSHAAGVRLGQQLAGVALAGVLVLSPGVQVNGSALVQGVAEALPQPVPIIGGLAGDNGAFASTSVLSQHGCSAQQVVAMAIPAGIRLGHGSFGGWQPFGPARKVTRCAGNILYELDGEPALSMYKRYLGEYAEQLPASGLLFPLEKLGPDHSQSGLVRTILGVDEAAGSLILAGDLVPDGYLRLMHASHDALIEGAEQAAGVALQRLGDEPVLAILVSCVGRKLVLGGRVDEEVEAVGEVLGSQAVLSGFYSYGEISPLGEVLTCKLHNQTMTLSVLADDLA
ncbi:FIST signal transduction protein [Chitinibacter tainanensis]|uniref:FIST signal transduction protein n=1 Tax=Chitinibacter tainanensis TaxID=230667 RepID=UPI002356991F|nr:FIST N-terminal domain-containing protein [Chitinibacter tainanensis]